MDAVAINVVVVVDMPDMEAAAAAAATASFCLSKLICCKSSFNKSCSVISGVILMLSDLDDVGVGVVVVFVFTLVRFVRLAVVVVVEFEHTLLVNLSRLSIDVLRFCPPFGKKKFML